MQPFIYFIFLKPQYITIITIIIIIAFLYAYNILYSAYIYIDINVDVCITYTHGSPLLNIVSYLTMPEVQPSFPQDTSEQRTAGRR